MIEASDKITWKFPQKLHKLLDDNFYSDIISWQPHGRSFRIHKKKEFERIVMPTLFQQSKIASFHRQLNHYGFKRQILESPDKGGYYHECFLRGRFQLSLSVHRVVSSGPKKNENDTRKVEPYFYSMKPLPMVKVESGHHMSNSNYDYQYRVMSNTCNESPCSINKGISNHHNMQEVCPKSLELPSLLEEKCFSKSDNRHASPKSHMYPPENSPYFHRNQKYETYSYEDDPSYSQDLLDIEPIEVDYSSPQLFDKYDDCKLLEEAQRHKLYFPTEWDIHSSDIRETF